MTIRVPMDQDLYDAAMKVMETLDEKMRRADRKATEEEVLGGKATAEAYRSWQRLLICKFCNSEEVVRSEQIVRTLVPRRRKPAKNHPWRTNPTKKPSI